jgi:hypothetical protein
MLVFEWETTRFEVVIEQHTTAARFKIERHPGEIIIDAGKFSCAVSLRPATFRHRPSARWTLAASVLAAAIGFTAGMGVSETEADILKPTREAFQPFTSD